MSKRGGIPLLNIINTFKFKVCVCVCSKQVEKEKRELARQYGMVRSEVSGGEIAEELEKERRSFQLSMCEVSDCLSPPPSPLPSLRPSSLIWLLLSQPRSSLCPVPPSWRAPQSSYFLSKESWARLNETILLGNYLKVQHKPLLKNLLQWLDAADCWPDLKLQLYYKVDTQMIDSVESSVLLPLPLPQSSDLPSNSKSWSVISIVDRRANKLNKPINLNKPCCCW